MCMRTCKRSMKKNYLLLKLQMFISSPKTTQSKLVIFIYLPIAQMIICHSRKFAEISKPFISIWFMYMYFELCFFSNQVQINLNKVVVFFVSNHQSNNEKHLLYVKFQLSDQNIFHKITLNLFFKIYMFSRIVFFNIFFTKKLQKSARNRHKSQFFMEKIYP